MIFVCMPTILIPALLIVARFVVVFCVCGLIASRKWNKSQAAGGLFLILFVISEFFLKFLF